MTLLIWFVTADHDVEDDSDFDALQFCKEHFQLNLVKASVRAAKRKMRSKHRRNNRRRRK